MSWIGSPPSYSRVSAPSTAEAPRHPIAEAREAELEESVVSEEEQGNGYSWLGRPCFALPQTSDSQSSRGWSLAPSGDSRSLSVGPWPRPEEGDEDSPVRTSHQLHQILERRSSMLLDKSESLVETIAMPQDQEVGNTDGSFGHNTISLSDHDVIYDKFECKDYVYILGLLVVPGVVATLPVVFPWGQAFAKNGDNSVAANWAYYFWYTPLGWAVIAMKIALWNAEFFQAEFFFPWMRGSHAHDHHVDKDVSWFKCTGSLAVVLLSSTSAVLLFLLGYRIFHNPVPFGTITVGVPIYIITFTGVYFFVLPRKFRRTWADVARVLKVWAPFMIWLSALCTHVALTWLLKEGVSAWEAGTPEYVAGTVSIQIAFLGIKELLCSLPLDSLIGEVNHDLALLWTVGYSAMSATFQDWMFPGMPSDAVGICLSITVMSLNVLLSFWELSRVRTPLQYTEVMMHGIVDVLSCPAFLFVYLYNSFGPNTQYVYYVCQLTHAEKIHGAQMVAVNFLVNVTKLFALYRLAPRIILDESVPREAKHFVKFALRHWYWLTTTLLIATYMACGECMVMKHDGMDVSFEFKEWQDE